MAKHLRLVIGDTPLLPGLLRSAKILRDEYGFNFERKLDNPRIRVRAADARYNIDEGYAIAMPMYL